MKEIGGYIELDTYTGKMLHSDGLKLNCGRNALAYIIKANGIYQNISFSEKLERFIVRKNLYKEPGDSVEFFDNASRALGIIFLKFNNSDEAKDILSNIQHLYEVNLI